jgi:adenylate cyclase
LRAALTAQISAKAEGNPLFIEEVVRALSERGGQDTLEALTIPDSLQALLTARLDRLKAGPRHTLQLAAVIGRSFETGVLAAISGGGPELGQAPAASSEADLTAARDWADAAGYFPLRHAVRVALADLHARQGDAQRAGRCRSEAARLLAELESSLRHPELRQSLARGFSAPSTR